MAVFEVHLVDVADFDFDFFARHDVGDMLGEDVGALLFEEGRGLTSGFGGFVDGAGFAAFFDVAFDDAIADFHAHSVNGSVFGEGEGVNGLNRLGGRVAEGLDDGDAGANASNVDVDGGLLEGDEESGGAVLSDDGHLAGGSSIGRL